MGAKRDRQREREKKQRGNMEGGMEAAGRGRERGEERGWRKPEWWRRSTHGKEKNVWRLDCTHTTGQ